MAALLFVACLFFLLESVASSDFRGGTMHWKPLEKDPSKFNGTVSVQGLCGKILTCHDLFTIICLLRLKLQYVLLGEEVQVAIIAINLLLVIKHFLGLEI